MGKNRSLEQHYNKWGYIFSIPFILGFLVFHLWPMGYTFYFAFCDLKHTELLDDAKLLVTQGLPWYKNFQDLFKTTTFIKAVRNTFIFMTGQIIPEWALAFWLAATMTDRRLKVKGRSVFKTAFFFPNLMTGSTLGGLIMANIIGAVTTSVGLTITAAYMNGFGITDKDFQLFFSDNFFIILVSVFIHFGITFIYAVAGMTSIPVEIFEAAEMDGSSRLNTFFKITLPCMRPILFFIVIVSVVDGLCASTVPGMLSRPYDVFQSNVTMMSYLEGILGMGSAYDRASAFCLVMLVFSATISGLIYFLLIRDRYEAKQRRLMRKEEKKNKKAFG